MIVKGSCEISLNRAELVEMLAKLYLLGGGCSSPDSEAAADIAKLVVKKCSLSAPGGEFSLSLTARQSLRVFALLEMAAGRYVTVDAYRLADTAADEISDRCDPTHFKLTPSEREFYMAAIDALDKSVGQRVTIRELSNQAGVQYEPFRRLVKRLEHIGYIERFGKLTASFDRDRAMELLRIGI